MNTLVKKITAATAAFAFVVAATLSVTDVPAAPATLDLASAGVDFAAAEYAVDMGADFSAEANVQTAFIFWIMALIIAAVTVGTVGLAGVAGAGYATGWHFGNSTYYG